MPEIFTPQSRPALLAALCLGLISGCQNNDTEFHAYQEPVQMAPPVGADQGPQTASNGIVPASAQTTKPLPEVAVLTTHKLAPASDPVARNTGPAAIGSALPSDPVAPGEPPAITKPSSPELAVAIPTASSAAVANAALTANPKTSQLPARPLELLIPEKTFKTEGSEGALRVSFDDVDLLKVLNAEPVPLDVEKHLPGWLSGLNGKTVRIRGWMFPPRSQTGLGGFLFVRDNQICCFGRTAKIYDKFGVRMRTGETTDYILGHPFDVVGRMAIKTILQDGELFLLYQIEDAVVIDK